MTKEQNREAIAQAIISAMAAKGMSRKQLADSMGRNPSEITRWLNGSHNFTIDTLFEISQAIGTMIPEMTPSSTVSGYGHATGLLQDPLGGTVPMHSIMIDSECYRKLKNKAYAEGIGIDKLAARIINRGITSANDSPVFPKVKLPTEIPDDLQKVFGCVSFSNGEIENDDRLKYILSR